MNEVRKPGTTGKENEQWLLNGSECSMWRNFPVNRLALRPREAAKALGICERSLWDLTNEGEVPHTRLGKSVLYPVDALRRWLDARVSAEGGQA